MAANLTQDVREEIKRLYAKLGNKTEVARILGVHRDTVIRHTLYAPQQAVSYPTVVEESYCPQTYDFGLQYRRVAALFDLHHPFHDIKAIDACVAFLRSWKPDLIVLPGDYMDFYPLSRFPKSPARDHSLQDEIDSFLTTKKKIETIGCELKLVDGNHDHRLFRHIQDHPSLYKLRALEIPRLLELSSQWQHYRNQSRLKVGRLIIHHGDLVGRGVSGKYPAKMMLDKMRVTNMFGHLHKEDISRVTEYNGEVTSSYAVGHMCDLNQVDYVANPNWQQGFATIELDEHGYENVTFRHVVHGQIYYEGKSYGLPQ